MKNYIILIAAVATVFMACGGDTEQTQIASLLTSTSDSLKQAETVLNSWTKQKFAEQVIDIAELEKALKSQKEGSSAHKEAKAAYESALKTYEEEKTEFLNARKAEIKVIYTQTNGIIAGIDDQISELDQTKKDPIVTTYVVGDTLFKDYFRVKGNVEATGNAMIIPELAGIVKSIYVQKGEPVKKGQLILELETEVLNKQLAEVETSLTLATDLYNRQNALWAQNIGSEVQLLEAKNRKEALENTKATLTEQKHMAEVRSPLKGVLEDLVPKVGEMAAPGMPIARVVNLDELYIEADLSERHFGAISVGGEALVSVQGMDDVTDWPATISRIGSYIKPDNRTFQIRVDFGANAPELIPNIVADLKINEFTQDSIVYLPNSMIQTDAIGNSYVWTLKPAEREDRNIAVKQIIKVGPTYQNFTAVFSGLSTGEIVVDKGDRKMRKDALVRVQEGSAKAMSAK
jgi:RND family efflux transporter MFP subunit